MHQNPDDAQPDDIEEKSFNSAKDEADIVSSDDQVNQETQN